MNRQLTLCLWIGFCGLPLAALAADTAVPLSLSRTHEHELASSAVGDSYVIQVRLPEKYDPAAGRYPVLYVLDGDFWFAAASDIATYLTMVQESPAMIVVGVSYGGSHRDWWRKRARDFTPRPRFDDDRATLPLAGHADQFQRFLATELFPFIERTYAARADDRTLAGYSLGGLFALHTLFTRAELFQHYIILAPAVDWDRKQILETEAAFHAKNSRLPATVFDTHGDQDPLQNHADWLAFDQLVAGRGYEGLRWTSHLFPGETHVSIYPVGLTRGLKVIHATPAAADASAATSPGQQAPAAPAVDPAPPFHLPRAREHRLASAAVGDNFIIQVRLPEKYDPAGARYPVLYVLDADFWFGAASDTATYLTMMKDSPAMIVVGIAYGGAHDDWWQKRARDYVPAPLHSPPPKEFPLAGGADRFQQFLATELFPFIEQHYAARADDRTLAGLSYGGTFATYTLFTRPELFQGYVILAPGLGGDKRRFFELETAYHAAHPALPATVFFAVGDQDKPGMVANWRKFGEQVAGHNYEGLRWTSALFPEETHISVYPVGLTRGLRTVHATAATVVPSHP